LIGRLVDWLIDPQSNRDVRSKKSFYQIFTEAIGEIGAKALLLGRFHRTVSGCHNRDLALLRQP
jgi:hypothetical protein